MESRRPFDARLQLLSERALDTSSWSTVSLITALREYVQRDEASVFPPCDEHQAKLTKCAEVLTDRGMDAYSLVRYGLLPELLGGMLSNAFSQLLDPEPPAVFVGAAKAEEWLELLRPRLNEFDISPETIGRADVSGFFSAVGVDLLPWMLSAPLNDILSLSPPTRAQMTDAPPPDPSDQELVELYRWAVDRFSVTNLRDWTLSSLQHELRWICGAEAPPCTVALMEEQTLDRGAIEAEVARHSVFPEEPTPHRQLRSSLASRMTRNAVALLQDMKFAEAAALFRFAVDESPDDPSALNNLAFCLMPTDPRAARSLLQRAADLGYKPPAVNLYNRILCAILLGSREVALQLATLEWPDLPDSNGRAHLWDIDGDRLVLSDLVDPRAHIAAMARRLADEHGQSGDVEMWQARCNAA